jgi:hypothetical protein
MIRGKLLSAGAVFGAIAALIAVSQPVQAGSCAVVTAKGRGLSEAAATTRSAKNLNGRINHWAHKSKLKAVHVGKASTACVKGAPLFVCTSSAKVCP